MYWGSLVLQNWPPLTWNNFLDGICMLYALDLRVDRDCSVMRHGCSCFGLLNLALVHHDTYHDANSGDESAFMVVWFKFLHSCLGRGFFLMYIGFRTVALGKHYCVTAGTLVVLLGACNMALHFMFSEDEAEQTSTVDDAWFVASNLSKTRGWIPFNCLTVLIGIGIVIAGVDGIYWGSLVLVHWPPLTWNNFLGAVAMTYGPQTRLFTVNASPHSCRLKFCFSDFQGSWCLHSCSRI